MDLELSTLHVNNASGVATVTIDHAPMNLLDAAMMIDLATLEAALRVDDGVRVLDRLAARVASYPPLAVRAAKRVVDATRRIVAPCNPAPRAAGA